MRISRKKYGNQFALHGLKPYTEYTVGIQGQDGSLKNATTTYQSFKTEEAGKIMIWNDLMYEFFKYICGATKYTIFNEIFKGIKYMKMKYMHN